MPALLLKLIPLRDWLYAGLVAAAVVWYNVHVHYLEVAYSAQRVAAVEQADKDATDRTLRAAKSAIDEKEKQYTLQLSQVEDTYENQLKDADAQHTSDLERVRQLTAADHRDGGSVLPGSGSAASGADGGPSRDQLLGVGATLADALRRDDAQLQSCWNERDSLTNK